MSAHDCDLLYYKIVKTCKLVDTIDENAEPNIYKNSFVKALKKYPIEIFELLPGDIFLNKYFIDDNIIHILNALKKYPEEICERLPHVLLNDLNFVLQAYPYSTNFLKYVDNHNLNYFLQEIKEFEKYKKIYHNQNHYKKKTHK